MSAAITNNFYKECNINVGKNQNTSKDFYKDKINIYSNEMEKLNDYNNSIDYTINTSESSISSTNNLSYDESSSGVSLLNNTYTDFPKFIVTTHYDKDDNFVLLSRRDIETSSRIVTNHYQNITTYTCLTYIIAFCCLLTLICFAYFTREYAKLTLLWVDSQSRWIVFIIFILLFIVVSFPVIVGYFGLIVAAGYLFGFWCGFLTVILGANLGTIIAHCTIRTCQRRLPIKRILRNDTARAILRVLSGPRSFRVVFFTRLTPIPFGLQNSIFGVSSINSRTYYTATFVGLLPAQAINVYLGSTLRSMQEVLNNKGTALSGYISFCIEVICGVILMCWVVQKARKELDETLHSDINTECKIIDITV